MLLLRQDSVQVTYVHGRRRRRQHGRVRHLHAGGARLRLRVTQRNGRLHRLVGGLHSGCRVVNGRLAAQLRLVEFQLRQL